MPLSFLSNSYKEFHIFMLKQEMQVRIYNSSPNSTRKQIVKIITKYIDIEITTFFNTFQNTLQSLQKLCVKSGGEKKK